MLREACRKTKKLITTERSLIIDVSLNSTKVTKDAIRVIGSGSAEIVAITPGLIRAHDLARENYKKRTVEERLTIDKEKQKQIHQEKEKEKSIKVLSGRNRFPSERKGVILNEEAEREAELQSVENIFNETNERLKEATKP